MYVNSVYKVILCDGVKYIFLYGTKINFLNLFLDFYLDMSTFFVFVYFCSINLLQQATPVTRNSKVEKQYVHLNVRFLC